MEALEDLCSEYLAALVAPDVRRARTLVDDALLAGADPAAVYLDVLQPALYEIGRCWERAEIGVAGEHLATSTTEAIMAGISSRLGASGGGRVRGRAVVACVGEELHRLGSRMVADFLEADGWEVDYLGAQTPGDELADFAAEAGADMVALSVTMGARLSQLAEACAALSRLDPRPFVVVGGQGLANLEDAATAMGADAVVSDPRALLEILSEGGAA